MENTKTMAVEANKEKGKELVKYYEQKGTPFVIAMRENEETNEKEYYIMCRGRVMTYPRKTYKEAQELIKYHSWELLTAFIFLITEIQNTKTQEEKK